MEKCRLCGTDTFVKSLRNLNDEKLMIESKLEESFNIKLVTAIGLSNRICLDCVQKTKDSFAFFKLINETQITLSNALNQLLSHKDIPVITDTVQGELPKTSEQLRRSNNREQLKRTTANRATSANRRKKVNPVITVEDIFVNELRGVYEVQPEQLNIADGAKNSDGTVIDDSEFQGWSTYDWKCVECQLRVNSSQDLIEHFRTEHEAAKLKFPCMDCKLVFKSYFSFQNHVLEHQPTLRFCCDICSEFRWNLVDLFKHRKMFHPKLKNTCLYCGKLFECGFNLKQHIYVHMSFKEDELLYCDICDFKAHTKFLVKQHLLIVHAQDNIKLVCEHCGKVCKRLADMVHKDDTQSTIISKL